MGVFLTSYSLLKFQDFAGGPGPLLKVADGIEAKQFDLPDTLPEQGSLIDLIGPGHNGTQRRTKSRRTLENRPKR